LRPKETSSLSVKDDGRPVIATQTLQGLRSRTNSRPTWDVGWTSQSRAALRLKKVV
jgi:hypothetical protein